MIADEIQSGIARSGRMLACDWEAVRPDVVVRPFKFHPFLHVPYFRYQDNLCFFLYFESKMLPESPSNMFLLFLSQRLVQDLFPTISIYLTMNKCVRVCHTHPHTHIFEHTYTHWSKQMLFSNILFR